MKIPRWIVRTLLLLSLVLAGLVSLEAYGAVRASEKEAWATLAAALAVITSVIGSWTAQRVLELEEDKQSPFPYPFIDVQSRYGLVQLRVKNLGGTVAHDVRLEWSNHGKPLGRDGGEALRAFEEPGVAVLLPDEDVSALIDGDVQFFQNNPLATFSGTVHYSTNSGHKFSHPFRISGEKFRHSMRHDDEQPKTLYELQKIPDRLEFIARELAKIREQQENTAARSTDEL